MLCIIDSFKYYTESRVNGNQMISVSNTNYSEIHSYWEKSFQNIRLVLVVKLIIIIQNYEYI